MSERETATNAYGIRYSAKTVHAFLIAGLCGCKLLVIRALSSLLQNSHDLNHEVNRKRLQSQRSFWVCVTHSLFPYRKNKHFSFVCVCVFRPSSQRHEGQVQLNPAVRIFRPFRIKQIIRHVGFSSKTKVKTMMLKVRLHQGEIKSYGFARGLTFTATTH